MNNATASIDAKSSPEHYLNRILPYANENSPIRAFCIRTRWIDIYFDDNPARFSYSREKLGLVESATLATLLLGGKEAYRYLREIHSWRRNIGTLYCPMI